MKREQQQWLAQSAIKVGINTYSSGEWD